MDVDATPRVIRNHRRFALSDVTFEGEPVGGATVDAWQNATGNECWSARVLMVPSSVRTAGALTGRTRDGKILRGQVTLVGPEPTPRPRGATLIEWHGVGALIADTPAEDA
jgi:hypothetical protein